MPPFGAEVGAGFPPFFPPLDEKDSLYALMAALAYGLRGFNLYMAVDRDRWVGAPIDVHGMPRRLADDYHALIEALDSVQFQHAAPARRPCSSSCRVRSAASRARRTRSGRSRRPRSTSPARVRSRAASRTTSVSARSAPIVGESFVRAFERALLARGVPFAYAGGESLDDEHRRRVVDRVHDGGRPEARRPRRRCAARSERGIVVTIGPRVPDRDGSMRLLAKPHDVRGLEVEPLDDPSRADVLVARRIDELSLPAYPVDVPDVHVTVHEDEHGVPRVGVRDEPDRQGACSRRSASASTRALVDLLPRPRATNRIEPHAGTGAFVVEVPARTVRMFSIEI